MTRPQNRDTRGDEGETLIELVITVAIMAICVVAIVGAFATGILMTDTHRKQATGGGYVRDYAETIAGFVAAGHYDASATPNYSPATVGFSPPAGYTATVGTVLCWNEAAMQFSSCATGNTVQRVTLTVASTDLRASERLVIVLRKP